MVPFQMSVQGMCIFGKNNLNSIRKSLNQEPPMHAHAMTQEEAFMICMKSICLFQQLRHQH